MTINLTSKPIIKTAYEVDEDNILTITFKDSLDVVIDVIVIENIKYRSLIRALEIISSERISSLDTQVGHRTIYKALDNEAETIFI